MTEHTPGPWHAVNRSADGGDDPFLGWDIEGPPQADRGQFTRGADARLIAAAPELLAALKRLAAAAAEWDWDVNADTGSDPDLDVARAAIAKAEGRQS